ncbi:MAG TPA: peptidylprolyl isomerase [Vicinamibacteria bacterium]
MRRTCGMIALVSVVACSRGPSPAPAASASPSASPSASVAAPPAADANRPLPQPLPDVAARVNGHAIPMRTVSSIVEPALHAGNVPPDRRPAAYRQALDQLVMRELITQEAQARHIAADETLVERDYKQARGQFKSDQDWTRFLSGSGFDATSFRTELRTRNLVDKVVRQEAEKLPAAVSDAEAKAFYDQNPKLFDAGERVRASHILLRVPEGAGAEVKKAQRAKAEAVLARVRKGEDFAALARQVSEDPGSAPRGGDLGAFGKGQMVPAFEQAAFALPAGQVSGLVESPFGFHIIKVQARLPAGKVPFDPVKEQIKGHLTQTRREKAVDDLVRGLKSKAKIETYL